MNSCDNEHRQTVRVKRVDEVTSLDELFRHCLPAFGGAYLRRIYTILDRAIGMGCPLTLAIAGPVTVSGQHQTYPMLPQHTSLSLQPCNCQFEIQIRFRQSPGDQEQLTSTGDSGLDDIGDSRPDSGGGDFSEPVRTVRQTGDAA